MTTQTITNWFSLDGLVERLDIIRHLDLPFLLLVLFMGLFGIWILEGAVLGNPFLERAVDRQFLFFWIAIGALLVATMIDYRWINRGALALYAFNLLALVAVLVGGERINGARSWISLGPVNWQPSETMKVAAVLVCAQWMALRPEEMTSWKGIFVPGLICGIPAGLILIQPDLGSASLFFFLFLAMMLMAGASRPKLIFVIISACIGVAAAFPFLKPYQKARLTTFINPEADPTGSGYNVIQSKVAIGNGGFFGRGWGEGTQGNFRFLPEHHTDFIYASLVEQLGLIGGLFVLMLYGLIIWRMVVAMSVAKDRFGGIVVAGLIAVIAGHVVMNIGMTMGLMPVTGIPLPFLSYGGSFLVTTFGLFGIVLNVASRRYTFVKL